MEIQEVIINPETEQAMGNFIQKFWSDKQELAANRIIHEISDNQIEKLESLKRGALWKQW